MCKLSLGHTDTQSRAGPTALAKRRAWESHGNGKTNMPKMGTGTVPVKMGMGMATFSCVPKFPSIGRLDANAICDFRLRIADISLQFINDLDWTARSACSKLRKQTGLSCVRTSDAYCATSQRRRSCGGPGVRTPAEIWLRGSTMYWTPAEI